MTTQNRLFVTIGIAWALALVVLVGVLVATRDTVHRLGRPPARVFDWTALLVWGGVICLAAVAAVLFTATWTEAGE